MRPKSGTLSEIFGKLRSFCRFGKSGIPSRGNLASEFPRSTFFSLSDNHLLESKPTVYGIGRNIGTFHRMRTGFAVNLLSFSMFFLRAKK